MKLWFFPKRLSFSLCFFFLVFEKCFFPFFFLKLKFQSKKPNKSVSYFSNCWGYARVHNPTQFHNYIKFQSAHYISWLLANPLGYTLLANHIYSSRLLQLISSSLVFRRSRRSRFEPLASAMLHLRPQEPHLRPQEPHPLGATTASAMHLLIPTSGVHHDKSILSTLS